MMLILDLEGYWIKVPQSEMYQFVIDLATGEKRFEEAVEWLRAYCVKR